MLNHDYIGTEHLLLGLVREYDGVAGKALTSLEISLEGVRGQVERDHRPGPGGTEGSHTRSRLAPRRCSNSPFEKPFNSATTTSGPNTSSSA